MVCRQLNSGACKTYLLVGGKGRQAALIDPLLDKVEEYLALLSREGLRLTHVVDTHTHADHLSGGVALRDKTQAAYLMHEDSRAVGVTRRVKAGETVELGGARASILHTPGHTGDSMSLVLTDRILTGDFLFLGDDGAGRLDLPGSDPAVHFDSLKRFDPLSDGLAVLPAHDYQGARESTLGAERRTNPVLSPRSREAYLRWWSERKACPADWMMDVVKANLAGVRDPKAVRIPKEGSVCAVGGPSAAPASVSAEELASWLQERPDEPGLIDVRTAEEFDGELGHIAGAVLIPVDELEARLAEVPRGPLVSICRSGKRAARAAEILAKAGRRDIRVLTGGMLAWNEKRLPLA